MTETMKPQIRKLTDSRKSISGAYSDRSFFPRYRRNRYLKMAYIDVPPGAKGTSHIHLGEELVYTIKGKAVLNIDGEDSFARGRYLFFDPPGRGAPGPGSGERELGGGGRLL